MLATPRLGRALRKGPAKTAASAGVVLALALALSGCGAAGDGRVKLDFFQFKPEAVGQFEKIVADFEAANPDIDVVINNVPDPDTAIRTLLVKNKTPDVLTLNGNGNFGDLAGACVFADLSELPSAARVSSSVQEILNGLGTCHGDESNGLPFANNASGILYNPDLFAKYGVSVPETWDELIAAANIFKANGVNPFFMTLKDAWTASPAYVNLAGNLMPPNFFDDVRSPGWTPASGTFSFEKNGGDAAAKLATLFSYAQPGAESAGYNDGNAAFAAGESAMYLQGSFAVPAIRASNPDAKIASFPYPTTNDPAKNTLVSGVDVTLAIGRETKHPAEARKFVEYLMSPAVLTNSLVAYAIARNLHRPFFKALYYFFIAALFVPFPIIMLPVTKEMAILGLDNPVGLFLLYTVYGLSFNIFVYTAFIKSIPVELEEAAIMDGASVWTTFRKVIFPILTPINATVGILTCLWAWNDFLLPLVILSDPDTRTLPLVQYVFQGQFNTDYTTAFASYLMAMAPLLLVYLFAQRWVISGVMRGSIK